MWSFQIYQTIFIIVGSLWPRGQSWWMWRRCQTVMTQRADRVKATAVLTFLWTECERRPLGCVNASHVALWWRWWGDIFDFFSPRNVSVKGLSVAVRTVHLHQVKFSDDILWFADEWRFRFYEWCEAVIWPTRTWRQESLTVTHLRTGIFPRL